MTQTRRNLVSSIAVGLGLLGGCVESSSSEDREITEVRSNDSRSGTHVPNHSPTETSTTVPRTAPSTDTETSEFTPLDGEPVTYEYPSTDNPNVKPRQRHIKKMTKKFWNSGTIAVNLISFQKDVFYVDTTVLSEFKSDKWYQDMAIPTNVLSYYNEHGYRPDWFQHDMMMEDKTEYRLILSAYEVDQIAKGEMSKKKARQTVDESLTDITEYK